MEIAAGYRRERALELQLGTTAQQGAKLFRIKRAARDLAKALSAYPGWVSVGSELEDDKELFLLFSAWVRMTPSFLKILSSGIEGQSADLELVEKQKGYLRAIRLSSNAKDWTKSRLYWRLFNQMTKPWGFRVYGAKYETKAVRFATHFFSFVDPNWQPTLKQVSDAIADFRKTPAIIRELEQLRSS